jgi:hypothetical protein
MYMIQWWEVGILILQVKYNINIHAVSYWMSPAMNISASKIWK